MHIKQMFATVFALILSGVMADNSPPVLPTTIPAPFANPTYCVSKPPRVDDANIPRKFGIVIFRAFEFMDVIGALEPIQRLAWDYKINLSIIAETLDPVTTEPVVPRPNSVGSDFYPKLLPTHTLANAPKDFDVLIVPGGSGTRVNTLNSTIDYIAEVGDSAKFLLTVCTGALLAAKPGLLDGRNATTNKQSWDQVIPFGKGTTWIRHARWTVDENVWTSSGVSSGIDTVLAWIECIYGAQSAYNVTNYMEYNRNLDPSNDPFAALSTPKSQTVVST